MFSTLAEKKLLIREMLLSTRTQSCMHSHGCRLAGNPPGRGRGTFDGVVALVPAQRRHERSCARGGRGWMVKFMQLKLTR